MDVIEPKSGDIMTRVTYLNESGQRTTSYFHTEESNWRTFTASLVENGTAFTVTHASEAEVDRILDCFFEGMARLMRDDRKAGGEQCSVK